MVSEFDVNSFQTPNAYVDKLLHLLTPEEWKVLSYMIRCIKGWRKEQDRISYSQMMIGKTKDNGEPQDHGTGLCRRAVINAIGGLMRYRLIVRAAGNDPRKNEGALWGLQLESDQVDYEGLWTRYHATHDTASLRMERARSSIQPKETVPHTTPQYDPHTTGQHRGVVLSDSITPSLFDSTTPVLPDNTNKIQLKNPSRESQDVDLSDSLRGETIPEAGGATVTPPAQIMDAPGLSAFEEGWKAAAQQLKLQMRPGDYQTHIQKLQLVSGGEGTLVLGAPTEYSAAWVRDRLTTTIARQIEPLIGVPVKIEVIHVQGGTNGKAA